MSKHERLKLAVTGAVWAVLLLTTALAFWHAPANADRPPTDEEIEFADRNKQILSYLYRRLDIVVARDAEKGIDRSPEAQRLLLDIERREARLLSDNVPDGGERPR